MANAPSLSQTTGQNAINTLQGPENPFTQAQGTLNQISSGAANPWIVDQSTGAVTPNTGTAMGGLFAAQQQELNQLMPNYSAPMQAGAIGSGNFGSLRGQTAVQKGRGDAFAKLNAQQLQAALTNQQTGVSAATGLGNVGQQGINANMNVGQTQMNAPFNNLANYSNLISSMPVPTTTQSQVQYSPLSQIAAIGNAATGGTAAVNNLLRNVGVPGGLSSLFRNINFGSGTTGTPAQQYGTDTATQDYLNANPGTTGRDDAGNIMPGWQNNADGGLSWSGNMDSGGTDYTAPDGPTPDWSATESYD